MKFACGYILYFNDLGEPEEQVLHIGTKEECPFCHETDFDLVRLKMHFQNGWCEVWEKI